MKQNFIRLVKNVKEDGTLEFDTYVTSSFIPFRLLYEATSIMGDMENKSESEAMEIMLDFVVRIYDNKFTKDDLLDKLHATDAVEEIQSQIEFIASGQIAEDRKKELKQILK